MTSQPLHLVGMSAVTPVGLSAEASAAAIRAGVKRLAEHPFMVDRDGQPLKCAWVPTISPQVLGAERLVQLAIQALLPMLQNLQSQGLQSIVVQLALPEERPGFSAADRQAALRTIEQQLPGNVALREAGRGHAGAVLGIRQAFDTPNHNRNTVHVVGGVDSYFNADTLDWLDADLRLARESRRGGFPPGEGAAFIALVNQELQYQLSRSSMAVILSATTTQEQRDETAPEGLLGEGLTRAYFEAANSLPEGDIFDDLYCDINDERARSTDLGFAALRAGYLLRDGSSYVTPVSSVGDIGAATLPLNCILAARAWQRGYAHGSTALVSAASWSGLRGAVAMTRA